MTRPAEAASFLRWLLLPLVSLLSVSPLSLSADDRFALELGVEQFRWQEFDDDNRRLLTEHGPRLVVAAAWDNHRLVGNGPVYALRVSGYAAGVDYDGQDSNGLFVATQANYRGWSGEFDLGWRNAGLGDSDVAVDLTGGIGIEQWRRDIRGGINSSGQQVGGLVEDYRVVYARAGLGLLHYPGPARGYLHLGARYPLSIVEDVFFRDQSLTLHPGERWAGFVSYQLTLDSMLQFGGRDPYLRLYYESWRFARSDTLLVNNLLVWQPRSHLDVFGIMLGVTY